jgi:ATP-dependent RNA helicase RhlE
LLQQWLPGYEPDLTKQNQPAKRSSKGKHKQQARNKALGHKSLKKKGNDYNTRVNSTISN